MRQGNFQSTTLIAGVVLLLILFVSVGYFFHIPGLNGDSNEPRELIELRGNFDTWQDTKPRSYRYIVERSCACSVAFTTPYIASDENGKLSAKFNVALEASSGEFLSVPPEPVWLEGIFGEIRTAIELHGETIVDVNYDPHYGFPTRVDIRYPGPETRKHYQIRDFEVLEHR